MDIGQAILPGSSHKLTSQHQTQTQTRDIDMLIEHLIYPASLPDPIPNSLSVVSYNVLLPNSEDGWWTYKNYCPSTNSNIITSWEHRRNLISEKLSNICADVVCVQETSPVSFENDFSFMKELGYDGCELYKKGRFRPATFWKRERCDLGCEPVHRDRVLLTTFRLADSSENGGNWHVLNCHLQAGLKAKRRVLQIEDGIASAVKLAKRLKETDPESLKLIVCGDFNCDGRDCSAIRYLEDGFLSPNYVEDGEIVTTKTRKLRTASSFIDVPASIQTRSPPPTLVVSELMTLLIDPSSSPGLPKLSDIAISRLKRIYNKYSSITNGSKEPTMKKEDVENWLIKINGKVGRGEEFRFAAKEMGWMPSNHGNEDESSSSDEKQNDRITLPDDGLLTLHGFINVYEDQLIKGKYWSIAYDLAVLGEPLPDAGLFMARLDRMYCTKALRPLAVLDSFCDEACPNEIEPSDHLPIAASFCHA